MPGTDKALRAARSGRPYERDKANLRAKRSVCCYCGHTIDKTLPPRHPNSFSADHDPPLSAFPAGQWRGTLRPAHYGCNASAGNGTKRSRTTLKTSRRW